MNQEYRSLEEKYLEENNLIDTLRRSNGQLVASLRILQDDVNNLKALNEKAEKNFSKASNEVVRVRRQLKERERECEELRAQMSNMSTNFDVRRKNKDLEDSGTRLAETAELARKTDQIKTLEHTISDLKGRLQSQMISDTAEKQALRNEIRNLKEENNELQSRMKLLLQEKEDIENHLRELGANGQFEQEDGNLKRVPTRNLKKIPRVRPEDVHQFGVLMNLRLRASRIPYDEVEKSVFKEGIVKKGCISIKEFEEILKGDPFRIREEGIALLIARYFIEDASDDFVILERDRTLELSIVRSIMKNLSLIHI
eukprot:TRINITY_DN5248_c0_g1_i6.p1 TRINITY_DN5248_c0_g1~~TRINITY_DN5248_c0_g1_i6.p1  ORF type:complete len:313 (-),score=81.56 TRINITY_DN5248_c0_g1_i6:60-998(-)